MNTNTLILSISFLVFIVPTIAQLQLKLLPRGDESKYTKSEEQALGKLRKMVHKDLYADYMHRDEYLIPWLRTRKLDVNKAADLLRSNLKWRKDENIDHILNDVFPQFAGSYQADHLSHTKDKMLVSMFAFSSWDVRKAALAGQMKSLIRYMVQNLFELPQLKAREEGQADGTNATRFLVLNDVNGYNLRQHGCIRCMEIYLGYVKHYESYYPQASNGAVLINTPRIFDPVIKLTRPFMSEHFFTTLFLLGPDKTEWKPKLDAIIDPSELPKRFGGTDSRTV